jgi:hypothetical protein
LTGRLSVTAVEIISTTASRGRYKEYFIGALTVSTLLPEIISVVKYSLFGNAFSPVVLSVSDLHFEQRSCVDYTYLSSRP